MKPVTYHIYAAGGSPVEGYFTLDLIPDPFLLLKTDGTILDLNTSCSNLIGSAKQDIIGRTYEGFDLLKACCAKVGGAVAGNTEGFDTTVYRDRHIEVFVLPFTSSDGTRLVRVMLKDISNFKDLEEELMKRNRELIVINTLSSVFISSNNIDSGVENLLGNILLVTDFATGWIMVRDGQSFRLKASRDLSPECVQALEQGSLDELCLRIAGNPEPLYVPEPSEIAGDECLRKEGLSSLAAVPLVLGSEVIGILFIANRGEKERSFNSELIALFSLVGKHISMILDKIRLFQETKRLSITDGLTGLYNSRYFYKQLEAEIARSARYGSSFSIIMFDIDSFKTLNDTYGHQAGDEVLIELGRILLRESRQSDIVVRYGGEEFVIILPNTSETDTIHLADRIRTSVGKTVFLSEQGACAKVTLSGGISSYPRNATSVRSLLNAADTALYSAKTSGKNKVICCAGSADA